MGNINTPTVPPKTALEYNQQQNEPEEKIHSRCENESANIIPVYSDVDDISVVIVGLILFAWFSRQSVVETESCVARLGFR